MLPVKALGKTPTYRFLVSSHCQQPLVLLVTLAPARIFTWPSSLHVHLLILCVSVLIRTPVFGFWDIPPSLMPLDKNISFPFTHRPQTSPRMPSPLSLWPRVDMEVRSAHQPSRLLLLKCSVRHSACSETSAVHFPEKPSLHGQWGHIVVWGCPIFGIGVGFVCNNGV